MGIFSDLVEGLNSSDASKGLLKYFSNQAIEGGPEGLVSYKKSEMGMYKLIPKSELKFSFTSETLPNDLKKKGVVDAVTLSQYLYSAQRSLSFDSAKISSEGYLIDPKKIILEPFNEDPYPINSIQKYIIQPQKFPDPHNIVFTFGGEDESFLLQRQPLEDFSKIWIKNVDSKPITVSILIDERKEKMTLNLEFRIDKAETISEALKYSILIDHFFEGNFKISGQKIENYFIEKEKFSMTPFLKMVKDVEVYLQKNIRYNFLFDPKGELLEEDYIFIHKLYYSFILKTAFKTDHEIDNVELDKQTVSPNFYKQIKSLVGKKELASFLMNRLDERMILNQNISINLAENFNGVKIIGVDEVENKIVIRLKQDEDYFSSAIYYVDETSERELDIFQKAKEIHYK